MTTDGFRYHETVMSDCLVRRQHEEQKIMLSDLGLGTIISLNHSQSTRHTMIWFQVWLIFNL